MVFATDTTATLLEQVPPTPLQPAHGFELLMLLSHVHMFAAVVHGAWHDRLPCIWDQIEPCYMTCLHDTYTHTHANMAPQQQQPSLGRADMWELEACLIQQIVSRQQPKHQHADMMIWVGNQRIDIDRVGSFRTSLGVQLIGFSVSSYYSLDILLTRRSTSHVLV